MQADPIVAEIRRLRELRAGRFGFDINSLVRDAQQRDAKGNLEVVRRPSRPAAVPARTAPNDVIVAANPPEISSVVPACPTRQPN